MHALTFSSAPHPPPHHATLPLLLPAAAHPTPPPPPLAHSPLPSPGHIHLSPAQGTSTSPECGTFTSSSPACHTSPVPPRLAILTSSSPAMAHPPLLGAALPPLLPGAPHIPRSSPTPVPPDSRQSPPPNGCCLRQPLAPWPPPLSVASNARKVGEKELENMIKRGR